MVDTFSRPSVALAVLVLSACPVGALRTSGESAFAASVKICRSATSVPDTIAAFETDGFVRATEKHSDVFFRTDGHQSLAEFAGFYATEGLNAQKRSYLLRVYDEDWESRVRDFQHRQSNGFGQYFFVHEESSTVVSVRQSRLEDGVTFLTTCGIRGNGGGVFDAVFDTFAPIQATLDPVDWVATRHDSSVRQSGGIELAKLFNPVPFEDVYSRKLFAIHFLMVRSSPLTGG